MTSLVPKTLKQHVSNQFVESFTEQANNVYYLLFSKHTEYANGDSQIPTPYESVDETITKVYQETIFGKKITSNNINLITNRYDWTSGTVYTSYDDQDEDLLDQQFYVVVDNGTYYYVYKCLDNNFGANSTVNPGGASGSTTESACNFITTADGYTWKLMYRTDATTFEKFATVDYMPVYTSSNVAGNTVAGAIDFIKVSNNGSNYITTYTGTLQVDDIRESIPTGGSSTTYRLANTASSNNDFYVGSALYISSGTGAGQLRSIVSYDAGTRTVTVNNAFTTAPLSGAQYTIAPGVVISGDGSGAQAYCTVSSNSTVNNYISKINIITRGSGYTYATATVTGNTGGISNNAVARVIIGPPGGHGKNAPTELGVFGVCISANVDRSESGFVTTENDYRKVILIKDVLLKSVTLTLDSESGTFSNNETINQITYQTLTGTVSANTTSQTVVGVSTEFDKSLIAGDYVMLYDSVGNYRSLRIVSSVSNSTQITLTSNNGFLSTIAKISKVNIIAEGVKSGNSSPFITLSNCEPKFVIGKDIIGVSSGAFANVTDIYVQEKSYNNWTTLDNRTRISYTANTGQFNEDTQVYQSITSLSNAYFHSANGTYVFLTSEQGPINADPTDPLLDTESSAQYTLGSVKYVPDIEKGSGEVLYIENNNPITRSNSQSETIRLIIKF